MHHTTTSDNMSIITNAAVLFHNSCQLAGFSGTPLNNITFSFATEFSYF